ncbi:hypothetical protein K227x_27140 [Rubripirellula lacrimiformis]|uniref:Uncharacterized protein n=1 Tax=Rubripirellula lacrimiformis TaxID=1930273 RepID=A0A517NB18_9BACT|nr:hypothetical protein K227x_27140 [Rubripirellula lacrimiformis]
MDARVRALEQNESTRVTTVDLAKGHIRATRHFLSGRIFSYTFLSGSPAAPLHCGQSHLRGTTTLTFYWTDGQSPFRSKLTLDKGTPHGGWCPNLRSNLFLSNQSQILFGSF